MLKVTKIERPDETPFYRIDEFKDEINNNYALSRYVGEVWDDRVNFEDDKWWTLDELKVIIKYLEESEHIKSCPAPIKKCDQYLTFGNSMVQ